MKNKFIGFRSKAAGRINIKLGKAGFTVINLTEPLRENVEVFPGDPKPQKKVFCSFEKDNCRHNIYLVGDHNHHPHGDAPNHQNLRCKKMGFEFWGLDFVFNKACLIDLSGSEGSVKSYGVTYLKKITDAHLSPYLARIGKSGALILRTGYDRWLESNKKHLPGGIPYLDKSAVDLISKFKKLKVIGIDSLTIDGTGKNYAHRKLKDKFIVESLVNLYGIPAKARSGFYLQTSPIAIVGATGGPVLAYAYIPKAGYRG